MRVVRLGGLEVPGIGELDARELPPGLVALLGTNGRTRRALHELFAPEQRDLSAVVTAPSGLDPALARIPHQWSDRLRTGLGFGTLEELVHAAARSLAWNEGLDRVTAARAGLAARLSTVTAPGLDEAARDRRLMELGSAPTERDRLNDELRALLEEQAQAAGELEGATAAWLRERQDAETHLQAYRDRARELRTRLQEVREGTSEALCPTCRRPLAEHAPMVLEFLSDEWEDVVQDGSWWRRRREQLGEKPGPLIELEQRVRQLHRAVATLSARVEVARARAAEFSELDATRRAEASTASGGASAGADLEAARAADAALERLDTQLEVEALGRLRDRAAAHLVRLTDGRLLGTGSNGPGHLALIGPEGPLRGPSDEDLAALELSFRLAAVELLWQSCGVPAPGWIAGHAFDRLDTEMKVRAAALFAERVRAGFGQILLVTRAGVVDLIPEAFDGVFELEPGAGDSATLRSSPAGVGELRLAQMPSSDQRSPSA